MNQKIIPVGEVSRFVRDLIAQEPFLRRLSVSGEVSNLTYHRSGHIYFTLKDKTAALSCVMWASDRRGLAFPMKEGDLVVVTGSVDFYMLQGRCQLYAKKIELQGAGMLYEKYLELKAELEEMGMFAEEYKQPIPFYVKRLGIVTAPTGAAVQDIRNIAKRRNPYIELILYPALVQGEGAAECIVRGIETLDRLGLDCIIVGRGGGSIEDLWAFNEEAVARAIFNCMTPVISAVGHETDTTIADYVADLRAPTPSAAAELAVCNIFDLIDRIEEYRAGLRQAAASRLEGARDRAREYSKVFRHLSPDIQIREKRRRCADAEDRLLGLMEQKIREKRTELGFLRERFRDRAGITIADRRQRLELLRGRLRDKPALLIGEKRHRLQLLVEKWEGLSPVRKLRQGYSYVTDADGHNVSSVKTVAEGDPLSIDVTDGEIYVRVTGTGKRNWSNEA